MTSPDPRPEFTFFCQRCDNPFSAYAVSTLCWQCVAGGATFAADMSLT